MPTKWKTITMEQGHLIRKALPDLVVFSCCTDPHGQYGTPSIYDEWGINGADYPILKAHSLYQNRDEFELGQDYPKRISTEWFIAINTKDEE